MVVFWIVTPGGCQSFGGNPGDGGCLFLVVLTYKNTWRQNPETTIGIFTAVKQLRSISAANADLSSNSRFGLSRVGFLKISSSDDGHGNSVCKVFDSLNLSA